ncbi:MAG TPA: translocation/assembly module TamB domain-containing protein [Allosphingosinicella sp.]|jgi:translocation and assembly module TamB
MADEAAIDEAPAPAAIPVGRHRARTAVKWVGIVLLGLLVLVTAFWIWLNSSLGHRYVVRQINNLEMASGLDIDVQRIEGSLFGELKVYGLTLKDTKGTFFTAPEATLDWRPLSYLKNHVDIKALTVPQARLMRLPELKPGDPNAPMLPDIDIDVGRFQVDRIAVDPAVTGYRHLLGLSGRAKIADGRAQVALDAGALDAPGLPGGDKLVLRVDAEPEANRLALGVRVEAPANGFVSGLTGIKQPLAALVTGSGDWKNWNGRARANLGGKQFANLSLGNKEGTWTFAGPLSPGLVLADGPAKKLLGDVQLNLTTGWKDRRADMRLRLNSAALALAAEGVADLGQNKFEGMKVAGRLLQPGAVAPGLTARDLRVEAVLNGAFATPFAAYNIRAGALGFNGTVLEGLTARGRAKIDTDRMRIPVSARARRITGLDPSVGGLLTNVAVDGTLFVSGTKIVSDDLKVRSEKLNATVVLAADTARGQYRFGINGTVNNYRLNGIGVMDITTDMDVVTSGGGFGLNGRVAIRTKMIENASARDFLGGNASASARVRMSEAGDVMLEDIRLNSPGLRVTSGRGTWSPNGRIDFRVAAVSRAYGAVAVVVTGTVDRPQVQLRAANPGFGIGLRDVTATIRATGNGYRINATGQSQYGPFTADVTVLQGRTLTLDVHRLLFAGMTFTGRVTQTAAGPFAGTLNVTGQGIDGVIRLAAAGRYQRADVDARANGATIPGETAITIQRALVQATVILYPDAPHIVGDAQFEGVRANNFFLARGRAKADYRGGRGTAQLFAEGSSGVPFRIAANAALTPELIRANLQGEVNRIPFRLARPAEIRKMGGNWQLSPTQLVLPQGNVLLAGRYGSAGTVIQSRLRDFDLSLLNAFAPTMGVSGKVSGSIDYAMPAGSAFPRADARLNVAGFSRTGIATRSPPVDLALLGELRPEGGSLNAVIRRGGAVVGRAQARLQPVGPGAGGWMERLLAAPLAGGIRYNGPAEVLWSFSGLSSQQLSGPIGVAADFTGRVQSPQLNGIVRANNLIFTDETYGTRITSLAVQGRFNNSTLELTRISGKAGPGTIEGQGTVGFAAASGYPIDIRLTLANAQLARSDNIGATVSGTIAITNSRAKGALISGDLNLPNLRYQIIRQGAAQVVELQGVRRKGEPLRPVGADAAEAGGTPSIWKLDLRVRADNQVFISGMGLESEWKADLRVTGTSATPEMVGEAEVLRGTFSFSGRRFDLTRGRIEFTGGRTFNPRIDLIATSEIEGVDVNINVSGTATNPQIAFTSNPGLPQDEIMARILFGGSVSEISALQAVQLATSLNALRGGGGGLNPLGKLRSATGLDRLRVLGADETTGRGTAVAAGFYISNDIYLELITDARGFTATQIEIALSKALSVLFQAGSSGGTNVNARYRKQY